MSRIGQGKTQQSESRAGVLRITVFLFLLVITASSSFAQLATNLTIDPSALSLGNAVTADPTGLSAISYNPAALTKIKGRRSELLFFGAKFDLQAKFKAPANYEVFGFSDDPVVCDQPELDDTGARTGGCVQFVDRSSELEGVALYIPVLDDIMKLPMTALPPTPTSLSFAVKPPNSKFTFANSFYMPLLAGFYRKEDDPSRFLGKEVALERITYLSPTIAYKYNDEWSFGLTFNFSYQAIALNTDFRVPNELLGFLRIMDESLCAPFSGETQQNPIADLFLVGLCNADQGLGPFKPLANLEVVMDQSLSPSFNFGVLWQPKPTFAWGFVYQSQSRMKLSGEFSINYDEATYQTFNSIASASTGQILLAVLGLPLGIDRVEEGNATMNLVYPQHIQTGIKYYPHPKWSIALDVGWTDYDQWSELEFRMDRPLAVLQLARILSPNATSASLSFPLGYESVWGWGVGVEYFATSRLSYRFGYEDRRSAIPDDRRSTLVPINAADLVGFGISYQWDKESTIDFSFAVLVSSDDIPADTSCNLNCEGLDNLIYNPYAGLDVETDTTITIFGFNYQTEF